MKQDSWLKIQTATMATLALFCSVGVVMSQRPDGPPPRMDPKRMVERQVTDMRERLKLTSDQEAKIKPIIEESVQKMVAMREKMEPGNPPSEEMMAEMRANREATAKKISEVLTKDQQAEYEKMMSERRGFGGPRGRKGPPKQ